MTDEKIISYTAVLQAGGKGTRMLPLTQDKIPKPLLKLGDKTMLEWQIVNLKKYGIKEFFIIVGHLGEMIEARLGNGSAYGVNIGYIYEQEPLGSGGALCYLRDKSLRDNLIITLGDVMFDIFLPRMIAFHERKQAAVTLAVHPNGHPYDSDLVVLDDNDRVIRFDDKNNKRNYWYENCVNAGIYICKAEILHNIIEVRRRDLEREIFLPYMKEGKLYGYRTPEYMKDAGTPERFHAVCEDLARGVWARRNLSGKQKCVFLDRDGTLNKYAGLLHKEDRLELEDGAAQAVKEFNAAGFLVIVITNQPVVARGLCSVQDVETINKKLSVLLGRHGAFFDDIAFCPHHPDKGYPEENPAFKIECECRKPKTGMIDKMVEKYNIDRQKSWFVGDSTVDIECGHRAELQTVLVKTGEGGRDGKYDITPDFTEENILSAAKRIIKEEKTHG